MTVVYRICICSFTYVNLEDFIVKLCISAEIRDRAERGEAGAAPEVLRRHIIEEVLVDF